MTPATAIALSGLTAATLKLNASASNLANDDDASAVGSTGDAPVQVADTAAPGGGVIAQAVTAKSASLIAYDPTSPIAGAPGQIDTPDIDPITEISHQLAASNAFGFSLRALKAADDEQQTLLDLTT